MNHSQHFRTVLANGLTIVSEEIKSVRSVSVGVWIKSGSRNESREINGAAHFLEHMLFKGTEKRSALEIARSLESVGGYLNAYTSKEHTCYYAEILNEQLPRAVDVLSDIICHSTFPAKEMEKEREVILDEIDSVEDMPDELVQEIFMEKLYPNHSLGLPILGTKETVSNLARQQLWQVYRETYTTGNIVIAAAGNLSHEHLVAMCEKKFILPENQSPAPVPAPEKIGAGEYTSYRPINQAHICLGTTALSYSDTRKYDLLLLNTLLGVGMGSRLFQNIREKHGLAYSIYSFLDFFRDNGLLAIYLGTERKKLSKAMKLLEKEIYRIHQKAVSKEELNRVKAQVKGNLLLGLESTARRMSRLAKMEIYLNEFQEIDQIIAQIDRVNRESLIEISRSIFETKDLLQVMLVPA